MEPIYSEGKARAELIFTGKDPSKIVLQSNCLVRLKVYQRQFLH